MQRPVRIIRSKMFISLGRSLINNNTLLCPQPNVLMSLCDIIYEYSLGIFFTLSKKIISNFLIGDDRGIENQRVACQNILAAGGITPLTGLLACRTDRIMFIAISAIHSLLLCLDQVCTLNPRCKIFLCPPPKKSVIY